MNIEFPTNIRVTFTHLAKDVMRKNHGVDVEWMCVIEILKVCNLYSTHAAWYPRGFGDTPNEAFNYAKAKYDKVKKY